MGCGASKASVVNPEKSNPDQPGKKQDNAENDEVVVEEDVTGRTSLLEAKDMKSDATSDLQKTSYGRLSDGATAEGGVTEMKDAEVSEMSAVSSRQDKYAAFNVPLSRDAKSPPAKFSDKSEKLDEKELMEKLNEKQRAAAARKEEELKRKANVTSRVSMKDRLRREIMESRRLEEEAALLEPEETEEDASTTPDEMERDTHFNELTEIGEF